LAVSGVMEPVAYPGDKWDQIYDIWIVLAVVIYLLVSLPMLYFLFKYRYRKDANERGADEHGSIGLEVLWTVVPLMIVIYLAVQSAVFYKDQRTAPADAITIRTTGSMWAWEFEYPNGKTSITNLYIPVGKPVKLELTSKDVIHAFYVREAKTMEDAIPGRVTTMWFQFNQTGEFKAYCREYCGIAHAYMIATIKVISPEAYETWVST